MRKTRVIIVTVVTALAGLLCPPGAAGDAGDWLIRLRALHVSPNDDSGSVSGIPGSSVNVGPDTTPELDFTWFLTSRIALEGILGTSQHNIRGEGSIAALGKIAKARTLPPTLTLQYHFQPQAHVRPYAGIGVNYTRFYDESASASLENALGPTNVELSDSWGLSGQLGIDLTIKGPWFFNLDAKYIRMDTTATLTSSGTKRRVDVNLNPWFLGVGIGRRF